MASPRPSVPQKAEDPCSAPYTYFPLPTPTSIRLLAFAPTSSAEAGVSCTLSAVDLRSELVYDALSYTWGSPFSIHSSEQYTTGAERCFPIRCDGTTLMVTKNLHDALLQMRQGDTEQKFLWIDALCINQEDLTERSSQVAMMNKIYLLAKSVVVWLGRADEFTQDFYTITRQIADLDDDRLTRATNNSLWDEADNSMLGLPKFEVDQWLAYGAFLNRSWFSRAWILQELVLSARAVVLCGPYSIPWDDLAKVLIFVHTAKWGQQISAFASKDADGRLEGSKRRLRGYRLAPFTDQILALDVGRQQVARGSYLNLEGLILLNRDRKASDPRDKIYAFLGAASKQAAPFDSFPNALYPVYTAPVAKVYAEVTRLLMLSKKHLSLLSHVQDPSHTALMGLPSWTPDYTVALTPNPLSRPATSAKKVPHWRAAGSLTWQVEKEHSNLAVLSVQGMHVDIVDHCAASFESCLERRDYVDLLEFGLHILEPPELADERRPTNSRHDVLWRCLLADHYGGKQPAPVLCNEIFLDWTASLAYELVKEAKRPGNDQAAAAKQRLDKLKDICDDLFGFPSKIFRDRVDRTLRLMLEGDWRTFNQSHYFAFLSQMNQICRGRRLFTTNGCLIGNGAQSLQQGDAIWILAGTDVPFVLRHVEGESFRLIGEAYVHGMMNGEALARSSTHTNNLKSIHLV